jgi:repressor LexA
VCVPLVGWMVAGTPVLSGKSIEGIAPWMDRRCLRALFCSGSEGDSMIGDHIQNGDLILVRPQPRTEDGAIGVAMVDGEATVKRLCRTGEGIHLVSSHPAMEPLSIRQDAQLRIIGKVVAVLRFLEPAFSLAPAPGMHAES